MVPEVKIGQRFPDVYWLLRDMPLPDIVVHLTFLSTGICLASCSPGSRYSVSLCNVGMKEMPHDPSLNKPILMSGAQLVGHWRNPPPPLQANGALPRSDRSTARSGHVGGPEVCKGRGRNDVLEPQGLYRPVARPLLGCGICRRYGLLGSPRLRLHFGEGREQEPEPKPLLV